MAPGAPANRLSRPYGNGPLTALTTTRKKVGERVAVVSAIGEVFREYGYAGASLAEISKRTGLGKGSLYHLFPGGKDEMAQAVLEDVANWFETNVFIPLNRKQQPAQGIDQMFRAVTRFFDSGRRICLVAAFALDDTRDHFVTEIQAYFGAWIGALAGALRRQGFAPQAARDTAEEVVAGIQGALMLARSQHNSVLFTRAIKRLRHRINAIPVRRGKGGG